MRALINEVENGSVVGEHGVHINTVVKYHLLGAESKFEPAGIWCVLLTNSA